jgi:hypothetical protein
LAPTRRVSVVQYIAAHAQIAPKKGAHRFPHTGHLTAQFQHRGVTAILPPVSAAMNFSHASSRSVQRFARRTGGAQSPGYRSCSQYSIIIYMVFILIDDAFHLITLTIDLIAGIAFFICKTDVHS